MASRLRLTSDTSGCLSKRDQYKTEQLSEDAVNVASNAREVMVSSVAPNNDMIQITVPKSDKALSGEAYLLMEEAKSLSDVPKPVFIVLRDDGFDLYSHLKNNETSCESIAYSETLIRCSLNQIPALEKPHVVQLEAGLRTIFICFAESIDRDECLTKILASVGQFLVLNPRSKKPILGKKTSNPLSPVSPLSLSAWPSTKQVHLSLLLNALDISSTPCLPSNRANSSFSSRFPAMLVSLCNTKSRRGHSKEARTVKTPVARSYTLPFSKYSMHLSCKQYSARNTIFNKHNGRSSLETRAALGILNIDSSNTRQYFPPV